MMGELERWAGAAGAGAAGATVGVFGLEDGAGVPALRALGGTYALAARTTPEYLRDERVSATAQIK